LTTHPAQQTIMPYSRRGFLHRSGQLVASAGITQFGLTSTLAAATTAASDRLVFGLIGCRGMGGSLMRHHLRQPGVVCGGLCDVDEPVLNERAAEAEERAGIRPTLYRDYRRLLENPDIDVVLIATPDHWHCLQAVEACAAGKDVYVEKPLANSIAEGALITRAARRYDRVVQVGQQQRSGVQWQEAREFVRSGALGKVRSVRIWANFPGSVGLPRVPDDAVPAGLDYEMWLGPAPYRPYNRNRLHGRWRYHWDYGGGLLTDWGVHLIDMPLWMLDIQEPPRSVSSIGGIYSVPDGEIETPDTQTVLYELDGLNMSWEHIGGIRTGPYGRNYGIALVGENGTLVADRVGWEVHPERDREGEPVIAAVPLRKGPSENNHDTHVQDFVESVRARREPACPVEAGELSALYSHLGNIALRTRSRVVWDAALQQFDGNDAANALIAPAYREPWQLPTV
jgi:predicted dehydrogenase